MGISTPDPITTRTRLEQLFQNLDRWRHLPNYQLERRADVLFSLYLPDLVQERVGRPVLPTMVPELPILCSLVWPQRQGMKSVKADYLLLAADRSEAYLVELKTDAGSRRDRQDDYLSRACIHRLRPVLEGVVEIAKASQSRHKYASLMRHLASLDLIRVPKTPSASREWFDEVVVLECPPELKTIYVQPASRADGETVIDFDTVRKHVGRYDDDFSKLFASYLERWAGEAGMEDPVTESRLES